MDWQPIDSAPKDGTWFLICRAGEPDSIEVGCFCPLMWADYLPAGDGLYRREDRQVHEWRGFNNMHAATHWAPAPAVPPAS